MRILLIAAALCIAAGHVAAEISPTHKSHYGTEGHQFAANCIKPRHPKPPEIVGSWENNCGFGVNVSWRLIDADGACEPLPGRSFACAAFVPAGKRQPAYIKGTVRWGACKAAGEYGQHGPFPMGTSDDRHGCYHLGFGPHQKEWLIRRLGNGIYTGELDAKGRFHGEGEYYWNGGDVYKGQFRHGDFHGRGTYTFSSGDAYSGEWVNDKRTGRTFVSRAKARIAAARERERREEAERQRRFEEEMEWEDEMNRQRRRARSSGGFMDTLTRELMDRSTDNLRRSMQNQRTPSSDSYSDCMNDPYRTTTCSP